MICENGTYSRNYHSFHLFNFFFLFRRVIVSSVLRKQENVTEKKHEHTHTHQQQKRNWFEPIDGIYVNKCKNKYEVLLWLMNPTFERRDNLKFVYMQKKDIHNISGGGDNDYATNTMSTDKVERTCARRARVEGEKWKRKWMRTIQQSEEWQSPKIAIRLRMQ